MWRPCYFFSCAFTLANASRHSVQILRMAYIPYAEIQGDLLLRRIHQEFVRAEVRKMPLESMTAEIWRLHLASRSAEDGGSLKNLRMLRSMLLESLAGDQLVSQLKHRSAEVRRMLLKWICAELPRLHLASMTADAQRMLQESTNAGGDGSRIDSW